ncbi:MAG: hypothetical protein AAFR49_19135, partial [Pseudomonadota bacterium]
NSMACVALPTCPLAMAEAERFLPDLVHQVEGLLAKHGVPEDHMILRVVGKATQAMEFFSCGVWKSSISP